MADTTKTQGNYNPNMIHMMASSSALTFGAMVSNLEMWAIYQNLMQQVDTQKMNSMATTGTVMQASTQSSGEAEASTQEAQGIQGIVSGGSSFVSLGVGMKLTSSVNQEAQQYMDNSDNNSVILEAVKYAQKNQGNNEFVMAKNNNVAQQGASKILEMADQLKSGEISAKDFDSKPKGLNNIFQDASGNYVKNPATGNIAVLDVLKGETVQLNGQPVKASDLFASQTFDANGNPLGPIAEDQNTLFRAIAKLNPKELTQLNEKISSQQKHNDSMVSNLRSQANNADQRWQQANQALASVAQGLASKMSSTYMVVKAMFDSVNAMFNTVLQLTTAQSQTMQSNISLAQQQQASTIQMMNSIASSQTSAA